MGWTGRLGLTHAALCMDQITNVEPTIEHRELDSGSKRPDGKEIQKGEDTCTRVADSVARW